MWDLDIKSNDVVSDLGKVGGGRAVNFGIKSPVEEIRKSNDFLKSIDKNSATTAEILKAMPNFKSSNGNPDEGLFGDDVPGT